MHGVVVTISLTEIGQCVVAGLYLLGVLGFVALCLWPRKKRKD